eukprot:jgi/Chrzof1/2276/Cz11g09160.t1
MLLSSTSSSSSSAMLSTTEAASALPLSTMLAAAATSRPTAVAGSTLAAGCSYILRAEADHKHHDHWTTLATAAKKDVKMLKRFPAQPSQAGGAFGISWSCSKQTRGRIAQ